MRTLDNGFIDFMCKLEGKPKRNVKSKFKKVHPLPKSLRPSLFIELLEIVLDEYSVGDELSQAHQVLVDRAIVWHTSNFENELSGLYSGDPLTEEMYEAFEGWQRTVEEHGLSEEFPL